MIKFIFALTLIFNLHATEGTIFSRVQDEIKKSDFQKLLESHQIEVNIFLKNIKKTSMHGGLINGTMIKTQGTEVQNGIDKNKTTSPRVQKVKVDIHKLTLRNNFLTISHQTLVYLHSKKNMNIEFLKNLNLNSIRVSTNNSLFKSAKQKILDLTNKQDQIIYKNITGYLDRKHGKVILLNANHWYKVLNHKISNQDLTQIIHLTLQQSNLNPDKFSSVLSNL